MSDTLWREQHVIPAAQPLPLSHPAAWSAFVHGARSEAARRGLPRPNLPDDPPAGISFGLVLRAMFAEPECDPDPAGAQP